MQLRLESLNHACVLLRLGELSLLCDPWLQGTAFSGGWGLYYDNPAALQTAAQASHLWISHWHSDHLHEPSLRALARLNPGLTVLVNESANFSLSERMRSLGFTRLVRLPERIPLPLSASVVVTRYPTAGIDNMLHVQAHGWSILNYNDCNLRPRALASLARKLGPLDLVLTHYNHAGKIFELRDTEVQKQILWEALGRVREVLGPRYVLPFASSHYYRSIHSQAQNASLLSFDELQARASAEPSMLVLRVGDSLSWQDPRATPRVERRLPALARQVEQTHDYGGSVPWETLLAAARTRCSSLQRGFPGLGYLLRPLRVAVTDHDRQLQLDLRRGASEATGAAPHIAAHSKAVQDWLGRPFGDDTFIAGAHFQVCDGSQAGLATLRHWVALCLLHASRLCVPDLLRYVRSREGRWFLWCRREEIAATLAAGGFDAGELRI